VRGHADAATLAAFREELLSARKAAQVSAHLAACPRCAALEAQLAEVTTLLNRATAPPMPEALTARIQAALAAEAASRTPAAPPVPEPVPAMASAPGHDGMRGSNGRRAREDAGHRTGWRGHDRSWLALRVAAVTAAVAVIAGGGYGGAQLLSGSSAVKGASGSGAAGPNMRGIPGPGPRMSAGGIRQAPGSSPGAGASGGGSGGGGSSGNLMAPLVRSSGTNYQPTSLGPQASAVLRQLTRSAHSSSTRPIPVAPTQIQKSLFPNLQACLIHVSHGRRPQLVDLAHYLGHPALIVVLPGANGAPPNAQVIAPRCTAILATAPLPHTG